LQLNAKFQLQHIVVSEQVHRQRHIISHPIIQLTKFNHLEAHPLTDSALTGTNVPLMLTVMALPWKLLSNPDTGGNESLTTQSKLKIMRQQFHTGTQVELQLTVYHNKI